ncbi:uncharacterized protein LOC117322105 [Pecten maximus]|uniref:uncharacterized protein LOC117322105 n=1 Tax=Pecten maximus TaxID=6579 RepID=UPI0014586BEC|nr:uncharacterized protein LOC117322105 [Pecten maximus]
MNYCPEIAVLQSALLLTNKQIGVKVKVKTSKSDIGLCVSVLHGAIQEICGGLEEDRDQKEQETWSRQLFLILLYKVISTHYREDKSAVKPGELVDKMDALCSVLPPVNKTVFLEVVKRCGWFQLFFDSLISVQEDVARSLLRDTVSHICEDGIDNNDLVWGKLIIDYFVGTLVTSPRTTGSHSNKNEANQSDSLQDKPMKMPSQSAGSNQVELSNGDVCITEGSAATSDLESVVCGLMTLTEMCRALKQIMIMNCQKVTEIKTKNCQNLPEVENQQQTFRELCQLMLLGVCFSPKSADKFNQISDWIKSNLFGSDVDDQIQNLPSQALGRYSCTAVVEQDTGLNSTLKDAPSAEFPWKCWINKIKYILTSETIKNILTNTDNNQLSEPILSFCSFVPLVSRGANAGKIVSRFIKLGCSPERVLGMAVQVLRDIPESCCGQNMILSPEDNLSLSKDSEFVVESLCDVLKISSPDVNRQVSYTRDWSMSAILWRIENRQPGYTDGLLRLLTTFDSEVWSNLSLIKTIQDNMAALITDDVMLKFYELVAKMADDMDPDSLCQLKELVLAGFSCLPWTVQDQHIALVYSSYGHWPRHHGRQLDGIITATLNKLTMEINENEKVVSELCQLALQDVETVIKGIVGRAASSAQQAEIAVKVLTRMSSVASGRTEGCNLSDELHQFLLSSQLSAKECRNILYFIQLSIMPQKSSHCEDEWKASPLLNVTVFIQKTTLPFLSVLCLCNQEQTMNTIFALEIIIGIFEAVKQHRALLANLLKSLATDSAPWLLCMAELWQYCVVLWESNQDTGLRLKLKENLVKFSTLLKSTNSSCDLFTYGPQTRVWLHSHLEQMDWSVQLHMAEIISPTAYQQECELEDFCLLLINDSGDYLELVRAATLSEVMMETVAGILTKSDTSLVYENMIVTLAQVLPQLVCEEWKRITQLITENFRWRTSDSAAQN